MICLDISCKEVFFCLVSLLTKAIYLQSKSVNSKRSTTTDQRDKKVRFTRSSTTTQSKQKSQTMVDAVRKTLDEEKWRNRIQEKVNLFVCVLREKQRGGGGEGCIYSMQVFNEDMRLVLIEKKCGVPITTLAGNRFVFTVSYTL